MDWASRIAMASVCWPKYSLSVSVARVTHLMMILSPETVRVEPSSMARPRLSTLSR